MSREYRSLCEKCDGCVFARGDLLDGTLCLGHAYEMVASECVAGEKARHHNFWQIAAVLIARIDELEERLSGHGH